ncbi:MAG: fluoride efflux transporter CrcB [Hyphomicrobiaceae bacterium]
MLYLWVAAGSAIGGVARYFCSGVALTILGPTFPWGTLIVNVVGSLLIGLVAAMTGPDGRIIVSGEVRQFLMTGVMGGFTTFSSFSLQTLNLVNEGEWLYAFANVTASVALCLLAVWLGYVAGQSLNG